MIRHLSTLCCEKVSEGKLAECCAPDLFRFNVIWLIHFLNCFEKFALNIISQECVLCYSNCSVTLNHSSHHNVCTEHFHYTTFVHFSPVYYITYSCRMSYELFSNRVHLWAKKLKVFFDKEMKCMCIGISMRPIDISYWKIVQSLVMEKKTAKHEADNNV